MKTHKKLYYKIFSVVAVVVFAFSNFPSVSQAQTATPNPSISGSCGLNIVLLIDSSSSMAQSDIDTEKTAATNLVNTLMSDSPTKIGLVEFNSGLYGPTLAPTANSTDVLNRISAIEHLDGASTNWQAGLAAAGGMTGPNDLIIMMTDGLPNTPDATTGLSNAITAANTIKSNGTRMLVLGVNSSGTEGGLNTPNLEDISGTQVSDFSTSITNINTVDVLTGDISNVGSALSNISTALCAGTLSVTATTPYNVLPVATVPFAYSYTNTTGYPTQCLLTDSTKTPVNGGAGAGAFDTANPINWAVSATPGTYGYYIECRNVTFPGITAFSNLVTVNVVAGPQPDLTATAPTQTTAYVNVPISFTSIVSNIGNADTGASFPVFFQVSTGPSGGGSMTIGTNITMATLAAGGVATATAPGDTFTAPGTWSVRTCANKTDQNTFGPIVESDYTNNCSSWTNVTIINALPDLTAAQIPQTTAYVNVPISFTSIISNIGNATTGASFPNFFQISTGPNGTGTMTIGTNFPMPALAAGASATATSAADTFTAPETWSIRSCANKTDQNTFGPIVESDNTNNCSPWTNVVVTNPPVPVVNISASPITGISGMINPTITWSATNTPSSCTATGDWSGSKAVGGGTESEGTLNTVKTYNYTLSCANAGGTSVPQTANVVVQAVPPPPTASLTSNPNPANITLGQSIVLTWTSTGASSCTGTNFNTGGATSNSSGVTVTPPTLPTTYTLVCVNSIGVPSAPSSVTANVFIKKKPIYTDH